MMTDRKERSKSTFNRQADTYDGDIYGQHARTLYPVLLRKLAHIPFQRALDLGCGTGEMMKMLLQSDDQRELYGIDLSEKMLSVAESKLSERFSWFLETVSIFRLRTISLMLCTAMIPSIIIRLRRRSFRSKKGFKTGRYIFNRRLLAALGWTRDYEFLYAP